MNLLPALLFCALGAVVGADLAFAAKDTIVENVNCPEWTSYRAASGEREWKTPDAIITVFDRTSHDIRLTAVHVTPENNEKLWQQIEWQCAPEYAAGMDNAFQNESIFFLVEHLEDK